ncbi:hypothetical protein [Nocardia abscessus]|uniref:hypothetical protein n=1 Tax=Nocardia abscessus TaxID=120957 RepID=UPI0024539A2D|nr:hypothetical protein [Nocardia abscessus]
MTAVIALGPEGTDSVSAARYWIARSADKSLTVATCRDYSSVFSDAGRYADSYVVIPAGYREASGATWVDLHFSSYGSQIRFVESFWLDTKPMAVMQADRWQKDAAIIHPATQGLLRLVPECEHINVAYSTSKPKAVEQFYREGYRYCIGSIDPAIAVPDGIRYLKIFRPTMVWCVYFVAPASP